MTATPDPADAALELLAAIQATADRVLKDLVEFRAEWNAHFGELRSDLRRLRPPVKP